MHDLVEAGGKARARYEGRGSGSGYAQVGLLGSGGSRYCLDDDGGRGRLDRGGDRRGRVVPYGDGRGRRLLDLDRVRRRVRRSSLCPGGCAIPARAKDVA